MSATRLAIDDRLDDLQQGLGDDLPNQLASHPATRDER
jgi:hypothetical protein